eukprot:gene22594-biopygen31260
MAAREDLHDQPGDNKILCNILRISPTSKLNDKRIRARNLEALALKDSTKVADAGAIPHLVALLSVDTPSVIQQGVVRALRYIALDNSDNQGKVAAAGAIPFLVALFTAYAHGIIVGIIVGITVGILFGILVGIYVGIIAGIIAGIIVGIYAGIVANNADNQGKVAYARAIPLLLTLMSSGILAHVQAHAAYALSNLVCDNPSNQGKVASGGAIPPLVALLSASSPPLVQDQAASALESLVANNACNQGKVASAASSPPLVQEQAASALESLFVFNACNQGKVASAGAIPLLVALLSASSPPLVQEQAASTLESLVANNACNQGKGKAASAGAIPPLLALLSAEGSLGLQEVAVKSLIQIAVCSTYTRKLMAAAGAITPLVGLMTHTSMAASASLIVTTLLSDPHVRAVFTSATLFLPLITLLRVNSLEQALVGAASALSHIASISPSIRRELAVAGIGPPLMAVRAASSTRPNVQEKLDMLHESLRDVCLCRNCVSKSKRLKGPSPHEGSSTSVLGHRGATTSVAEPVDSDKLMQELLEEEEREKSMKEAKAVAKKEKKQRQKGKKKGKSKEEQLAADQVSEREGKDAEKHLLQQQTAGEGDDDDDDDQLCVVCLDRERNVYLQPCRHVIMCSRCCDKVLAKSSKCPVCRAQVSDYAILD